MEYQFSGSLFGYNKKDVDDYINQMVEDYENELTKKKDRLVELSEENRTLRKQLANLSDELDQFRAREESIAKALLNAEETAQRTLDNAEKQKQAVFAKLEEETRAWEDKNDNLRKQLMDFEESLLALAEKYQSEINYIASKDVKKTYFGAKQNPKTA